MSGGRLSSDYSSGDISETKDGEAQVKTMPGTQLKQENNSMLGTKRTYKKQEVIYFAEVRIVSSYMVVLLNFILHFMF